MKKETNRQNLVRIDSRIADLKPNDFYQGQRIVKIVKESKHTLIVHLPNKVTISHRPNDIITIFRPPSRKGGQKKQILSVCITCRRKFSPKEEHQMICGHFQCQKYIERLKGGNDAAK